MGGKSSSPFQDLYSGGIGVFIGVGMLFYAQSMRDQVTSNPLSQWTASSNTWTTINAITAFAVLFIVAGLFYVARGLMAQTRDRSRPDSSPSAPRALAECPVCKEQIRVGAQKCRYCGADVDWDE